MYYLGRFLQLVGLGIGLFGILIGFDASTGERAMWTFCLAGLAAFLAGHWIIPKR